MLSSETKEIQKKHLPESELVQANGDTTPTTTVPNRTRMENCLYFVKNITVEPILSCLILASIITSFATQNLFLEKACRVNLNFTTEICDAIMNQEVGSENHYEREVQLLVSQYLPYKTYITSVTISLLTMLAGCYSDTTGQRKFFIMLSLVGSICLCINNILNTVFFYQLRLEVLVFSDAVIEGLSGGFSLPGFIMLTYIVAITTEEERTFRMGLVNFSSSIGLTLGTALSGVLVKQYSYSVSYGLALGIHMINFLYTLFILKETKKTPEQEKYASKGALWRMGSFFNVLNLADSFRIFSRYGLRIFVYMIVSSILFGLLSAEAALLYLMLRYRFNWDELQYSLYQVYHFVVTNVGTMFAVSVFSRLWGWHDSLLGIISNISMIGAAFVFCFAPSGGYFYLGTAVEFLFTSVLPIRALTSKVVDVQDLGKVLSIFSLAESLSPLAIVTLYISVYQASINTLPGAYFLVGAGIVLPTTFVYAWLFYEHRRDLIKNTDKKA